MSLCLRYMRMSDIPEVLGIEQVSFSPPWSARSYAYEIGESTYSHMALLEERSQPRAVPLWRRLLARLAGTASPDDGGRVVAYGGLWLIGGEGHISTIASHPELRGRGYGEIVLAGMLLRSLTLGADYVILEVRISNTVAQNLYSKYGFVIEGVKPKYYQSNNEDAYDMRLQISGVQGAAEALRSRCTAVMQQHGVTDAYAAVPPPPH